MKKEILLPCLMILVLSCKFHLGADRNSAGGDKIYKLTLNPPVGSKYHYDLSNESKIDMEVSDKEIENTKKTDVGINYEVSKDSAGDFLLGMTYDKIHVHTKNGDVSSDLDAADASSSTDPVEEFLGALKNAKMVATVSCLGIVKGLSGYQEVANQVLAGIDASAADKAKAQIQWRQVVEQGMIKKNIAQLFNIFPDSAVHIGDKWKLFSTEKSDINYAVKDFYTLRSIDDGIANIESEGEIETDSTSSNVMGSDVTSDLKGIQEGEYSMDIRTGMLLGCKITTNIEGTVQTMGQDVKIKVENKIKAGGQKL